MHQQPLENAVSAQSQSQQDVKQNYVCELVSLQHKGWDRRRAYSRIAATQ